MDKAMDFGEDVPWLAARPEDSERDQELSAWLTVKDDLLDLPGVRSNDTATAKPEPAPRVTPRKVPRPTSKTKALKPLRRTNSESALCAPQVSPKPPPSPTASETGYRPRDSFRPQTSPRVLQAANLTVSSPSSPRLAKKDRPNLPRPRPSPASEMRPPFVISRNRAPPPSPPVRATTPPRALSPPRAPSPYTAPSPPLRLTPSSSRPPSPDVDQAYHTAELLFDPPGSEPVDVLTSVLSFPREIFTKDEQKALITQAVSAVQDASIPVVRPVLSKSPELAYPPNFFKCRLLAASRSKTVALMADRGYTRDIRELSTPSVYQFGSSRPFPPIAPRMSGDRPSTVSFYDPRYEMRTADGGVFAPFSEEAQKAARVTTAPGGPRRRLSALLQDTVLERVDKRRHEARRSPVRVKKSPGRLEKRFQFSFSPAPLVLLDPEKHPKPPEPVARPRFEGLPNQRAISTAPAVSRWNSERADHLGDWKEKSRRRGRHLGEDKNQKWGGTSSSVDKWGSGGDKSQMLAERSNQGPPLPNPSSANVQSWPWGQ